MGVTKITLYTRHRSSLWLPLLRQFLGFLTRDLANHPERLQSIDAGFVQRLRTLTGGIDVDLDAVLSADDE